MDADNRYPTPRHPNRYTAHSQALQSFIEKVTVFRSATGYVDTELAQPTTSEVIAETGARSYKLATLYDKYHEYAELLAAQGLATVAVKYAALTPADYRTDAHGVSARDRLQASIGKAIKGECSTHSHDGDVSLSTVVHVALNCPLSPSQHPLQRNRCNKLAPPSLRPISRLR